MIKYFFLIPINPIKEWVKFNKDINESNNLKDEGLALFLLYFLSILGYSYIYSIFFDEALFNLDSSIELYLRSIVELGIVFLLLA